MARGRTLVDKVQISADEFLAQPETNHIVELIGGEVTMTMLIALHQEIIGSLCFTLHSAFPVGTYRLAPPDVPIDDQTVVELDIFWA